MKFNKWILCVGTIAACAFSAVQKGNGQDFFNSQKILEVGAPQYLSGIATQNTWTNGPADLIAYTGRGDIILNVGTNAGGTVTAQVYTSPDSTNWTAAANFATVTSTTSVNYTNPYYGGTNLVVTDNYLMPGTLTTPAAYSAGFATPYTAPIPNLFTNAAGAVTVTGKANPYLIGINATDSSRYIYIIWTATGAATNGNTYVSAQFIGNQKWAP